MTAYGSVGSTNIIIVTILFKDTSIKFILTEAAFRFSHHVGSLYRHAQSWYNYPHPPPQSRGNLGKFQSLPSFRFGVTWDIYFGLLSSICLSFSHIQPRHLRVEGFSFFPSLLPELWLYPEEREHTLLVRSLLCLFPSCFLYLQLFFFCFFHRLGYYLFGIKGFGLLCFIGVLNRKHHLNKIRQEKRKKEDWRERKESYPV